ncbi:hypothetical protein [Kitasatospora sp. NPDC088779]|uniref:hypothetical protein n=1 Tax=Kitasatospora sp. NPDC088779 TaxID=3154964 RepID=UPI00342E869C
MVRFVLVPVVVGLALFISSGSSPADDTIWNIGVSHDAAAPKTMALANDTIWN